MHSDVRGSRFGASSDLRSVSVRYSQPAAHGGWRAAGRTDRREPYQGVVCDERDRDVHDEQDCDSPGRLSLDQDVDVGQPEHEGDEHRHPQEHPPRRRRDPRGDRPRDAGDEHTDHGQLAVVRELEVLVPLRGGKGGLGDGDEQRVGEQRAGERRHGGERKLRT